MTAIMAENLTDIVFTHFDDLKADGRIFILAAVNDSCRYVHYSTIFLGVQDTTFSTAISGTSRAEKDLALLV